MKIKRIVRITITILIIIIVSNNTAIALNQDISTNESWQDKIGQFLERLE